MKKFTKVTRKCQALLLVMPLLLLLAIMSRAETAKAATALNMYYDDRILLSELQGTGTVSITNEKVTSYQVGTKTLDKHVVISENGRLIAVGTGTAKVTIGGVEYAVSVSKAPITMVMVTGHSFAYGLMAYANESIVCDDGWAYDTRIKIPSDGTELSVEAGMGIGYGSDKRPEGIDVLTSAGLGMIGNDSAIAYRYKQLTNEKIWVINTGIGGTNLANWNPTEKGISYVNAVSLFQKAEQIMKNEITAGHYTLRHLGVVNHGAENGDQLWDVTKYKTAFEAMWNGFKTDLAYDFDGDGRKETFDCLTVMPVSRAYSGRFWTDPLYENPYEFNNGQVANYYMAYFGMPDVIIGNTVGREWLTDQAVEAYFKKYQVSSFYTKNHKGKLPDNPTVMRNGVFGDGVHHNQLGYNITGIQAIESMCKYWAGTNNATLAKLVLEDGVTEAVGTSEKPFVLDKAGSVRMIPVSQSGVKLIAQTSGCITYEYPCTVRATGEGTGTLTIKSATGATLTTVVFKVGNGGGSQVHVCGNGILVTGKAATCTQTGMKNYYKCSCGKNYVEQACTTLISDVNTWTVIPALNHDFTGAYDGFDKQTHWHICNRPGCNAKEQPVAHGGGTMVPTTWETCTTDGIKRHFVCVCGEHFVDPDYTLYIENFDAWVIRPALGHDMAPATCTTKAYCLREGCNYTEGSALGHDFTGAYDAFDESSHWHVCNRAGCIVTDQPQPHYGGTATTTAQAVCEGCKAPYGTLQAAPIDLSTATVTLEKSSYNYSGTAKQPKVTVKLKKKTLVKDVDYKVSYSNHIMVGKATVTITGKGKYTGKAKATFQILPAKVSLKTPTTKKGQMTVTWTANAKQGASYKIQYSTTKTFESKKSVTVTSPKTGSKTIKDLKSGKTYYVRIRAYKQVAGKTYTGSWSTVRYVKIK